MTASRQHISFIDILRGVAVLSVLAFHTLGVSYGYDHLEWSGWFRNFHNVSRSFLALTPLAFGCAGVPIFFVVSGFCIHLSHQTSKEKSFKVFVARRFFRIYPPYVAAVLFFALCLPLSKLNLFTIYGAGQLISHLLLIHNLHHSSLYGINGSFWSIAVEAQLYLLYPALLVVAKRIGWNGALWLTGAIEILARTGTTIWGPMPAWFTCSPFYFWFSWSIGAVLAEGLLKGQPHKLRRCPLWFWPSLTIFSYYIKPMFEFYFTAASLSAATVIAWRLMRPVAANSSDPSFLVPDFLKWTGRISYSIYLYHQPFLFLMSLAVTSVVPRVHPLIILATCLAVGWPFILSLSYCSYRFTEYPAIQLGKWFIRRNLPPRDLEVRGAVQPLPR